MLVSECFFYVIRDVGIVKQCIQIPRYSIKAVNLLPAAVVLGFEHGDREAQGVVNNLVLYVCDAHPLQPHVVKVAVDVAALVVAQRVRNELPRRRAAHEEQGQDYDYECAMSHGLARRVVCSMVWRVAVRAWALLT